MKGQVTLNEFVLKCHEQLAKLMENEANKDTVDKSRYNALLQADNLLFSTMKEMTEGN